MLRMFQILATSLAVLKVRQRLRASAVSAMIMASGLAIGVTGAGFCLAAAWLYLAEEYGAVAAGLWLGGGLILFAMLMTATMLAIHRRNARYEYPVPAPEQ